MDEHEISQDKRIEALEKQVEYLLTSVSLLQRLMVQDLQNKKSTKTILNE